MSKNALKSESWLIESSGNRTRRYLRQYPEKRIWEPWRFSRFIVGKFLEDQQYFDTHVSFELTRFTVLYTVIKTVVS